MAEKLDLSQRILQLLRTQGPMAPADIMDKLGISQPTLYRAVKKQPEKIIALGARRNRKIAALRPVRNLGSEFPVFMVSRNGDIAPAGNLLALHPRTYCFIPANSPSLPNFYSALPHFLRDSSPSGFLGDLFSRNFPEFNLPKRSEDWSQEDILEAIVRAGENLSGNMLVGELSYARFLEQSRKEVKTITTSNAVKAFSELAKAVSDGFIPENSFIGGKQSKFTAIAEDHRGIARAVVVKFSPLGNNFSAQRWRDLLICEFLALETLRESGIQTSKARIFEGEGRVFLEMERFDREDTVGRKRLLSFAGLGALRLGNSASWVTLGAQLVRMGKISPEDQEVIQRLECFSRMIANNHRHENNLAFMPAPGEPRATLAPVFDMLPAHFAPPEATNPPTAPASDYPPPQCESTLVASWKKMLPAAVQFWESVANDSRISDEFKSIAARALHALGKKRAAA